ncbi:MAG: DMT family transporter [Rhizobiaceae bacterium]
MASVAESRIQAVARPMSAREWAMLLALGIVWGGSFFFAKVAVVEMHPLALVLLRVGIAAAALHLWLVARGLSFRLAFPFWGWLLALGLLNNVLPFSLIFAGQVHLGAGVASVLNATTPFWTALIANAATQDEKLSLNKVAGIGLGIAGTAAMIGPDLGDAASGPIWPKIALIGASVSYALALMIAKRLSVLPPPVVATAQLTVSTLVMTPVVLVVGAHAGLTAVATTVWAAVLGLALISTAFAYLLYFSIVRSAGATNASLVTLIVPASAILLGVGLLGERIEAYEIVGMAIIAAGLVIIDGRILNRICRNKSSQSGR